ncbi:hypothetical protein BDZ89DRAFT_323095 [Hymenopellis radicata]|nr:hypothetical protein BDZ89DRAFT_323095 [Hymenopellis radicata]
MLDVPHGGAPSSDVRTKTSSRGHRSNQPVGAKRIPEPEGWLGDFFRLFGAHQAGPFTPVRCMNFVDLRS